MVGRSSSDPDQEGRVPVRYTVKQVSQLTGISTDLLRAWERRYSVVAPRRTASRYRLYGDDDVARLRRMAELVATGAPASLAAEQAIAESPPVDGAEDAAAVTGAGSTVPAQLRAAPDDTTSWAPLALPSSALPPLDALTEAARDLDRAGLEHTLDRALAAGSFESVFDEWLTPALVRVGEAWADDEISVAGEHFVSAAVHRRLSQAFDAAGTAINAPVVVVGLPPRTLHELGAMAFAICLRRRGVDVRYLGADLPVESWVSAVRRLTPAAVAVSVPRTADAAAAEDLVRALADAHPELRIFAGGRGVEDWGQEQPAVVLEGSVTRSAHDLAVSLAT
jgi:MerR family transcriptional regulator, light-induced transcriptional regulator